MLLAAKLQIIVLHYSFKDLSVIAITVKTGDSKIAATDSPIDIEICDGRNKCCSTSLDREGRSDFSSVTTDVFDREEELVTCNDVRLNAEQLRVRLSMMGVRIHGL